MVFIKFLNCESTLRVCYTIEKKNKFKFLVAFMIELTLK